MDIAISLNTNIAQIDTCTDIDNGYQQLLKHNVELPINSKLFLRQETIKNAIKNNFTCCILIGRNTLKYIHRLCCETFL